MGIRRDAARLILTLATKAVVAEVQLARRCAGALSCLSKSTSVKTTVTNDMFSLLRTEALSLAREWTTLNISYWADVANIVLTRYRRLADSTVASASAGGIQTRSTDDAGRTQQYRRINVEMHGLVGERVHRSFVFENRLSTPLEISFVASHFSGRGGLPSFNADVRFEPQRMLLAPKEDGHFGLTVHIYPNLFVAGESYSATVFVQGYEDIQLDLLVHVIASDLAKSQQSGGRGVSPRASKRDKGKQIPSQKRNRTTGTRNVS